ncbi:hypothetical protein AX15_004782 [Amanita polypyramis BW_CC]|nr:hypothetical protein AX15_004782 [Amanita polypyramis BW_CC]
MSLAELSEAIGNMRDDVRVVHADIRMNTKVTKTMLDFMRGLKASKTLPEQTASAVAKARPPPSRNSREKRKRESDKMEVDGDIMDSSSDSSEDEQLAKKVKWSGATIATNANTTSGSGVGTAPRPGSSLPNLRPTLTSGSSAAAAAAAATTTATSRFTLPQAPPSAPTLPPAQPKMDRLAGVRAARAAAGLGRTGGPLPPIRTSLPPKPIGTIPNGKGPQSPYVNSGGTLPSPGTPFALLRGGVGVPIHQPLPGSLPLPPTPVPSVSLPIHAPNSHISQPAPMPPQQQLFRQSVSGAPQSTSTSTLTPANPSLPLFLPGTPTQFGFAAIQGGAGAVNGGGSAGGNDGAGNGGARGPGRERKEREQWELDRYGRVQKEYPLDYKWDVGGAGIGGAGGMKRGGGK